MRAHCAPLLSPLPLSAPRLTRHSSRTLALGLTLAALLLSFRGWRPAQALTADSPQPASVTISSPGPQIGTLSTSTRYVVWTATRFCAGDATPAACTPQVLYLYDLQTGRTSVTARTAYGTTGALYHYHVSDDWLVYLDTGLTTAPPRIKWRIVDQNLETHRSSVLAQSTGASASGVPPDLALAGTTLVWIANQSVSPHVQESFVFVTDLATDQTRTLARTRTPYSFSSPATDGQRVVWERDLVAGTQVSSAILGLDLTAQHAPLRVLSSTMVASQPSILGDLVVWKSGPSFAPGQIMLGSWSDASTPPQPLSSLPGQAYSPVIGDGFVAWSTGSSGLISIYDLQTGRTMPPHGAKPNWIYGFPTASGPWLAYSYMTGVPSPQGSPPPRGFITLRYIDVDLPSNP